MTWLEGCQKKFILNVEQYHWKSTTFQPVLYNYLKGTCINSERYSLGQVVVKRWTQYKKLYGDVMTFATYTPSQVHVCRPLHKEIIMTTHKGQMQ